MEIAKHTHFFISYSPADEQWAEWIAWQLEAAGYTTLVQAWDFQAGRIFALELDAALRQAERVLALLSPDYLKTGWSSAQWAYAFQQDPGGEERRLIPILIRPCRIEGLLSQVISIDITHLDEQAARTLLLDRIEPARRKPQTAPGYPGIQTSQQQPPSFPNAPAHVSSSIPRVVEAGTAMQHEQLHAPRPQPLARSIPAMGEHFLTPGDRETLIQLVITIIDPMSAGGIKNLLRGPLPERRIERITYRGVSSRNLTEAIIEMLEPRGAAFDPPYNHALGVFLWNLIQTNEASYDAAVTLTAMLFAYRLIQDTQQMKQLSARFQVPSPVLSDELVLSHPLSPAPVAGSLITAADMWKRFETLYHRRRYLLDVRFLLRGAQAARSVCRIDFEKRGEGTGFLVAPDLILTNYHVLMPPGYTGSLDVRAQRCELTFGIIEGISAGTRFTLHRDTWLLEQSPLEELDFMLLRLNRPVTMQEQIVPLSLESASIQEDECVNIIQHPQGRSMEVSIRFNQVVKVGEKRVYYLADTEDGSSGAPVFDDNWKLVAIHHAGEELDTAGKLAIKANVGVPIAAIRPRIAGYLKE